MSNLYKNFILCGNSDFFCLLCKESFKLPAEVGKHIRWENHKKLLKVQAYFPKFRKDFIYKTSQHENEFYCEVCNYVLPSTDAITKHIGSENHKNNKSTAHTQNRNINNNTTYENKEIEIKDSELYLVTINKAVVVDKKEWQGVSKGKCYFCDESVNAKDFKSHIAGPRHIVKFVQARIVKEDQQYYRKLNDEMLYCFKCKGSIPAESVKDHWEKIHNCIESQPEENSVNCRECKQVVRFTHEAIQKHYDEIHDDNEFIKNNGGVEAAVVAYFYGYDHGKCRSQLKDFGKQHSIKLLEGGRKGYCMICLVHVVAHISNIREHAKGARHQGILNMNAQKTDKESKDEDKPKSYKTIPWVKFIDTVEKIGDSHLSMINGEFPIPTTSFLGVAKIEHEKKSWKCFVCDVTFRNTAAMKRHALLHEKKASAVPTITSFKGEIIREVSPNVYHCALCNAIYPGYSVLERHLNSMKHKQTKMETNSAFHEAIESMLGPEQYAEVMYKVELDNLLD